MANLENLTPFSAIAMPSMLPDGNDVLLVVVQGVFGLPPAGEPCLQPLQPLPEQPPVRLLDEYWGEPDASSLHYEGQSAPVRPGTDVYLNGQAWAPKGKATKRVDVGLRIGDAINKTIAVFGERVWTAGGGMTSPIPFVSMPLLYERAFGGAEPTSAERRAFEPRNPVGRGVYLNRTQATDKPLPNLEDPYDLITSLSSRPAPTCFGPMARSWQPRARYAGTYNQKWVDERIPHWPQDFDERFFHAASPGMMTAPHFVGNEPVAITGVTPDGPLQFRLPHYRLLDKSYLRTGRARNVMVLDAVLIEPDLGTITLTWRNATPLRKDIFEHEHSVVRTLEPWELPS